MDVGGEQKAVKEIGVKNKVFSLQEAQELMPLIKSVTQAHAAELAPLQARLNKMLSNDIRRAVLEREFEVIVSRWKSKIENVGAAVSGLWQVEFDLGEGCLAWRFPELGLTHFKVHGTVFAERVKLIDYIEEYDPDWAR